MVKLLCCQEWYKSRSFAYQVLKSIFTAFAKLHICQPIFICLEQSIYSGKSFTCLPTLATVWKKPHIKRRPYQHIYFHGGELIKSYHSEIHFDRDVNNQSFPLLILHDWIGMSHRRSTNNMTKWTRTSYSLTVYPIFQKRMEQSKAVETTYYASAHYDSLWEGRCMYFYHWKMSDRVLLSLWVPCYSDIWT